MTELRYLSTYSHNPLSTFSHIPLRLHNALTESTYSKPIHKVVYTIFHTDLPKMLPKKLPKVVLSCLKLSKVIESYLNIHIYIYTYINKKAKNLFSYFANITPLTTHTTYPIPHTTSPSRLRHLEKPAAMTTGRGRLRGSPVMSHFLPPKMRRAALFTEKALAEKTGMAKGWCE